MLKDIIKVTSFMLMCAIGVCMFMYGLLGLNIVVLAIGLTLAVIGGVMFNLMFDDDCDVLEVEAE